MSVKNQNSIVTDGLVFYVDAGNSNSYPGSGTTWSDLAGSNSGTLEPAAGPTYDSANGGSIVFDGTDDYVSFSNFTSVASTGTVCQWFKPAISWSNSAPSQTMRMAGIEPDWEFGRTNSNDNGSIAFDLGSNASLEGNIRTSNKTWSNTLWYNLTVVWDVSTLSSALYLNGILDNTGDVTNSPRNGTFTIGRSPGNTSQVWYGNIASVKYYNRALSASEVLQNYNALKNRFV